MKAKTCEEFVLQELEEARNKIERLELELEGLDNQYNDIDYLQRLFVANGNVQSEMNQGRKRVKITYKFNFTSTETDTTEACNLRKLLKILNIDVNKCYKDNEEE